MIIGVFLRNYKCYKGAHFIPFALKTPEKLNVFIGNNGSGKSSILESLDTYFNSREWIIHHESKQNEAFVSPLFLYEKEAFSHLNTLQLDILNIISSGMWQLQMNSNSSFKTYESFFEMRDKLNEYKETHYLFHFSKQFDSNFSTFQPFKSYLEGELTDKIEKFQRKDLLKLKEIIMSNISYLYIPVETSISEFLKLETRGMQDIMNVDIKRKITDALSNRRIKRNTGRGRSKQLSLLDIINEQLDQFINEIEATIQNLDQGYNFSKEYKSKIKLTSNHISNVIIESYFSRRKLKKDKKPIATLSAGERKRALIDITYSFLKNRGKEEKELILAIDEPESSLHISQCYEQFAKINTITEELNTQVLTTTHWYGSLPLFRSGTLNHISFDSDSPKNKLFYIENYFEERKHHPDDIHLKSFYDLSSSILSSTKLQKTNWILVEGIEDKIYLEYYLGNINCKIIPLGGCSIVKLIYEYLYLPLSQNSEAKNLEGKIFCLIDTDTQGIKLNTQSDNKEKSLKIRRLQFDNAKKEVVLKKVNDDYKSQTEMEESLNPTQFYVSLSICIEKYGTIHEKTAFEQFELDSSLNTSFIKGDESILNHFGNGRNARLDKKIITDFIDNNKFNLAKEYTSYNSSTALVSWVEEIRNFFQVDID